MIPSRNVLSWWKVLEMDNMFQEMKLDFFTDHRADSNVTFQIHLDS